jgi:hypothetical protein
LRCAVYPAVPDVAVSYDFSYTVQLPAGGGQVRSDAAVRRSPHSGRRGATAAHRLRAV